MGLGSSSAYSQLKPGARVATGEPDVGDNKNGPPNTGNGTNNNNGGTGAPITPHPNGYRWIIAAWAARYLGVGW